jgi:hypothetical protein
MATVWVKKCTAARRRLAEEALVFQSRFAMVMLSSFLGKGPTADAGLCTNPKTEMRTMSRSLFILQETKMDKDGVLDATRLNHVNSLQIRLFIESGMSYEHRAIMSMGKGEAKVRIPAEIKENVGNKVSAGRVQEGSRGTLVPVDALKQDQEGNTEILVGIRGI